MYIDSYILNIIHVACILHLCILCMCVQKPMSYNFSLLGTPACLFQKDTFCQFLWDFYLGKHEIMKKILNLFPPVGLSRSFNSLE